MRYLKSFLEFILESNQNKISYNKRGLYDNFCDWEIDYSDYVNSYKNHDIIEKFKERYSNKSSDLKKDMNSYTEEIINYLNNNFIKDVFICFDFKDVKIVCDVSYYDNSIKIKTYLDSNMKSKRNTKYIKIK